MRRFVQAAVVASLVTLGSGCVRSGFPGAGDGAADGSADSIPTVEDLERIEAALRDSATDSAVPDQRQPADLPRTEQAVPPDATPPTDLTLPPDKTAQPDTKTPPDLPGTLDPNGSYTLTPTVSYKCAISLVNFTIDTASFVDNGKTLIVTTGPTGPLGGCAVLTGDTAFDGEFTATCTYAGGCTEVYTLKGTFGSTSGWIGSYNADYTGNCLNCVSQSWTVAGTLN